MNVEIVFGEPEHSTIRLMKNLRWIQMTWAGANKYTSASKFPDSTVIETMQYLKSQVVFQSAWSFFERDQLLYASALVINECTRSQNLTIVQQMMFVAAILSEDINDY